jgi:hypothetical protein
MWISEQTAIISLHKISGLAFITVLGCVYCAVRTESLQFRLYLVFGGNANFIPVIMDSYEHEVNNYCIRSVK